MIISGICREKDVFAKGGLAVKSARGFIVLFGFTFVNALIKTLVAESHNKDNVEVKHASFDLAMKNQVNTMNAAWGGQWDSKEIMISMGAHATTDNLARCGEFTVAFATKETMVAADNDGTGNRKIGAVFAIQENKAYFCTQVTL